MPAPTTSAGTVLVVGAGMYGATVARILADAGRKVKVLDRRNHIGGNCFTRWDEASQCHEHVYGAHIFHTNNAEVWQFLSRFTQWRPYLHKVKVASHGKMFPLPFNLHTWQLLHGPGTVRELQARVKADCTEIGDPDTVEGWCCRNIGWEAYHTLVEQYTRKQWGRDPALLPASIIRRLPIRWDYNDHYFTDTYQGIPMRGYTRMFERMLEGIPVETEATWDGRMNGCEHVFYSGGLDELFGYSLGELEYRRVEFQRTWTRDDTQGQAVINHAALDVGYTRTIEHRYFDGYTFTDASAPALITREYPAKWERGQDGYYPVRDEVNTRLHELYTELATEEYGRRLTIGGRQGRYQYYDMHQVAAMGMKDAKAYLRGS